MQMAFLRFGMTGLVNTAIGYSVILAALWAGYGDFAANAMGYSAGLVTGFFINRNWVFGASKAAGQKSQALRYVIAFLGAYALNLAILNLFRTMGYVDSPLAQLFAMAGYTAAFFLASKHFVFAERISKPSLGDKWPEYAFAAICVTSVLLSPLIPLTHDVIWQLWIARQTAGGQQLYLDILELNPPLWFWMGSTIYYSASFVGLKATTMLAMTLTGLAGVSAWLSGRLMPPMDNFRRFAFMVFVFLVLTVTPLYDFGQREHIALIGALPYTLLIAQRLEGARPSFGLVIAASLFGAAAFALKHYFVVVPIMLEALLFAVRGRKYRMFRTETVCLAISAAVYAVSVLTLTPHFFADIVPMVSLAYHGYERPLIAQFDEPAQVLWLVALFCYAKFGRFSISLMTPRQAVLLLSAGGFLFSYFAQQKGWQYHAIPASGFIAIAVFDAFLIRKPFSYANLRRNRLAAVVCAFAIIMGLAIGPYQNEKYGHMKVHFDDLPRGSNILFLTHAPTDAWPMVEEYHLQWSSRHFAFWQLPAIVRSDPLGDDHAQLQLLGKQIIRETINDTQCNVPDRIIIRTLPSGRDYYDIVYSDFFIKDIKFAKLMQNYQVAHASEGFVSYDLKRNSQFQAGTNCRNIIAE